MQILPVIDLIHGQVVRGVAGRRSEYKPIVSRLTTSTDPIDIALAFREHFGFNQLYVADLDAIAGKPPALAVYDALQQRGFHLWVDAGLKKDSDALPLLHGGVASVIAGLETIAGPETLKELLACVTPARLVFSLDLKNRQALTDSESWPNRDPLSIAAHAVSLGARRLLVLDLAQVGVGAGVGTETICRRLRERYPRLEIAAGGGVRDFRDVQSLAQVGGDWALVASALHDGRLSRDDVASAMAYSAGPV